MKLDTDRIAHIAGRMALMAANNDFRELGNVALELLVLRNSAQDVLEGDYDQKEKQEARAFLTNLRELEQKVAQLYARSLLRRERARVSTPFTHNVFRRVKVPI